MKSPDAGFNHRESAWNDEKDVEDRRPRYDGLFRDSCLQIRSSTCQRILLSGARKRISQKFSFIRTL